MTDEIDRETLERAATLKAEAEARHEAERSPALVEFVSAKAVVEEAAKEFAGLDVAFLTCTCGKMSTRLPCHECTARKERQKKAADEDALQGIPARFRWASIGTQLDMRVKVVPSKHYASPSECAKRLAASAKIAALLIGASGMGKTSLAVAAMRLVRGAFFVPATVLERARIEHQSGHGEAPIVARAMRCRLLVIDDLGQDKETQVTAVEAVILARHNASLRTWVTTGLDAGSTSGFPALAKRYNDGLVRRLTEVGTSRVIRFREAA